MEKKKFPQFVIATSSGIYYAQRAEDLATTLKKLGYVLTKGISATEIALDVAHEVQYTQSKEIRYVAEKQGITLLLHGSLTVPFEIPEISDYTQAQNHARLSIKSGVYIGAKYVLFHACLHFWPELITYTGHKLEIIPCGPDGKFISFLLHDNKDLRKWFIERYGYEKDLFRYILLGDEIDLLRTKEREYFINFLDTEVKRVLEENNVSNSEEIVKKTKEILENFGVAQAWEAVKDFLNKRLPPNVVESISKKFEDSVSKKSIIDVLERKFTGKSHFNWRMKERLFSLWDTFNIIAHYVWLTRNENPLWNEMRRLTQYKNLIDRLEDEYKRSGNSKLSFLEYVWLNYVEAGKPEAETFKEFFYALASGQMLIGHLENLLKWIESRNKDGLFAQIEKEMKDAEGKTDKKELEIFQKIIDELAITLEVPDARSPEYAGRYNLWRPSQILAVVKAAREILSKKGFKHAQKIFMTIDFEHIATHGVDPWSEIQMFVKDFPDAGKYIISIHSNYPNPLHPHLPLEFGDVNYYRLFWYLRQAGLGKYHTVYLIFERGGGQEPFKQSIPVLRTVASLLEKDIPPEKLPLEFYGISPKEIASIERQLANIKAHALDPLKGLIMYPEEEHGELGRKAVEKGKVREWKGEEFR